jgi:YcxB-like protein
LKVEYTLTPEDFAACAHSPGANGLRPWAGVTWLFVVPVIGAVALAAAEILPWTTALSFCLPFLAFLFSLWYAKRRLPALLRRHGFRDRTMSLEVRPEGLTVTTGTTTSLTAWEGIDRIVVSGNYTFFGCGGNGAHILPRRAFTEERDFEKFVESSRDYRVAAQRKAEAEQS